MADKITRRWKAAGLLLAVSMCLNGCGQLEIEKRSFPLALAVSPAVGQDGYEFTFFFEEMESAGSSLYQKDNVTLTAAGYPQAYAMFGRLQAAQPDDSHMQTILLSESLAGDTQFLGSFYRYAMKEHHFSWNTIVYFTQSDSLDKEELADATGGHPGSYLMNMAQSDEQEKNAGVPTLGDLYMEQQNREKVLLLPVLGDHWPPHVDHYVVQSCGLPQQTVAPDTARLIQLLQGKLHKMQLGLADGTIVELSGIRSERRYLPQNGRWCVELHMDAVAQNRLQLSEQERARLQQESTDLLCKRLAPVTKWAQIRDSDGQLVQPQYMIDLQVLE